MSEEKKVPSANLNFEKNEIELLDDKGQPLTDETSKALSTEVEEEELGKIATIKKKVGSAAKNVIKYSPLGMTYTVSKGMMEMMDRSVNSNDLNKVENINFEQIVDLIKSGKDDFEELNMTFTAAQSNGINIGQLKKEVGDQDVTIGLGKKGGIGLAINVKYKK